MPKTKPTEEVLQAMREDVAAWSEAILADERTVFLDLETTGLPDPENPPEIVQISVMNVKGRPLLNLMLKPEGPIPVQASDCHGILDEDVEDCPSFSEVAPLIEKYLKDKVVVTYNADFDWKVLTSVFKKHGLPKPQAFDVQCAMDQYAIWVGQWAPRKQDFKWQKLPNLSGRLAHDSLVDCENLHKLIQKMSLPPGEERNISEEEIDLKF
jgi:DNA polymerase III epsilon subunit-like protein